MITYTLALQTIASLTGIATSTSMIIAYRQLRLASRNSQLSFEDALAREFRQVANRIPFTALLGGEISETELTDALPAFYMYFDLSDEQVFQRRHGRVSDLTWANWADGIRDTVNRPAFAQARRSSSPVGPRRSATCAGSLPMGQAKTPRTGRGCWLRRC